MIFDAHIKEGCKVRVLEKGPFHTPDERRMIGKTGQVVRAYVSSARVEIDGKPMMFSKSVLELVKQST